MIGLALSGGGSRAMAFHLGCLRALKDLEILDRVSVMSTISGGSVIGAYYAYTPDKSFEDFEHDIRSFLRVGFQKKIALELLKPNNFIPSAANLLLSWTQDLCGRFVKFEKAQRYPSRTDMFHRVLQRDVFTGINLETPRRNNIDIVIGACELRTGSAFRFSNQRSGGWRHGTIENQQIDVAFAVAASAAYPIFLPAFDRTWTFTKESNKQELRVCLTDGGVYDNLGTQVLEPGRNPKFCLHTFPCDYLIVCNAGHGQDAGEILPSAFPQRVGRSFEVVHRRVQDSTMGRLYHFTNSGLLKGFAMPYLGQQDDQLPWPPTSLVPREEVISYPTDFAAMSESWINKISDRGEQLTRSLVPYYLSDLLI